MAWRSLLALSKRNKGLSAFSNRISELQHIKSASNLYRGQGISEVCASNSGDASDFGSFRPLTSSSTPLEASPRTSAASAPVLQDCCVEPVAVPASTGTFQVDNGEILYAGMTSKELVSTLFNLYLVAYEPVVDLSIKVLKSPLMKPAVFRIPLLQAVKRTAYSHFCAGENVAEASATLQRMWELGLKGILDYSLEDATDNACCDKNLQEFLNTINTTLRLPAGSVSFACVKITALCPLPLLERVSDLLRWRHSHPEQRLLWLHDTLPILAPSSPTYHTAKPPAPLTDAEERDLRLAEERLHTLCKACEESALPLLVDAEYTSVQPAIDYFTYSATLEFNKSAKPLVYGTVQAYLKDALPRLQLASDEATRRGVQIGLKLVRGAYITRESALAASLGAPSPIHSSIQETHRCYDACAAFMMEKAAVAEGSVVLATHNFDSGKAATAKAEELNIRKGNDRVQFAQLKGMADGLSLGLVQAGFLVSKYLPFGPVDHVMPYLIRRAEENRGLLSTTMADRRRLRTELGRRLQAVIAQG
uniref:Proline dehydrogenase n=2 Tax=Wollemia nobilis TaxID=56998 RepID=A0A0C9S838_9CONI